MISIPLTPEQFTTQKAKIEAELGQTLAAPSGTIEHDGVKLSYSYDGKAALTVNILHKPFVMPQSIIEGKIREWFHG